MVTEYHTQAYNQPDSWGVEPTSATTGSVHHYQYRQGTSKTYPSLERDDAQAHPPTIFVKEEQVSTDSKSNPFASSSSKGTNDSCSNQVMVTICLDTSTDSCKSTSKTKMKTGPSAHKVLGSINSTITTIHMIRHLPNSRVKRSS
jgi:hypothetical protein